VLTPQSADSDVNQTTTSEVIRGPVTTCSDVDHARTAEDIRHIMFDYFRDIPGALINDPDDNILVSSVRTSPTAVSMENDMGAVVELPELESNIDSFYAKRDLYVVGQSDSLVTTYTTPAQKSADIWNANTSLKVVWLGSSLKSGPSRETRLLVAGGLWGLTSGCLIELLAVAWRRRPTEPGGSRVIERSDSAAGAGESIVKQVAKTRKGDTQKRKSRKR